MHSMKVSCIYLKFDLGIIIIIADIGGDSEGKNYAGTGPRVYSEIKTSLPPLKVSKDEVHYG